MRGSADAPRPGGIKKMVNRSVPRLSVSVRLSGDTRINLKHSLTPNILQHPSAERIPPMGNHMLLLNHRIMRRLETKNAEEIRRHLVARADGETNCRDELGKNPKGAFEKEIGVEIPEGVSIHVHQENDTDFHIVLPSDNKLNEAQLEAMSGGQQIWSDNTNNMRN